MKKSIYIFFGVIFGILYVDKRINAFTSCRKIKHNLLEGLQIPSISFYNGVRREKNNNTLTQRVENTTFYFQDRNCIVLNVPQLYGDENTKSQILEYEMFAPVFSQLNIDAIYCSSPHDCFTQQSWGQTIRLKEKNEPQKSVFHNIMFIPDTKRHFATFLGFQSQKYDLENFRASLFIQNNTIQKVFIDYPDDNVFLTLNQTRANNMLLFLSNFFG